MKFKQKALSVSIIKIKWKKEKVIILGEIKANIKYSISDFKVKVSRFKTVYLAEVNSLLIITMQSLSC